VEEEEEEDDAEATRGRVSTLEEFGLALSGIPTIRYIRVAVGRG